MDYAGSVGLKKSQEVLECRPGTPALLLWSLEQQDMQAEEYVDVIVKLRHHENRINH